MLTSFQLEKVYVMSLPGREDRLAPMLDAANATDISLTVLSAVSDDQIEGKDRPKGWDQDGHALGVLGCLMSHARTWHLYAYPFLHHIVLLLISHRMMTENIATALILESDADWDLRVRDSMREVANGVRKIVDWPFTKEHHKGDPKTQPYGDSWDLIWIGHCGAGHYGNVRSYNWNDSSVPPEDKEWKIAGSLDYRQHPPGTRALFQVEGVVCTTGYIMSQSGARKFSKYFQEGDKPVDLHMSDVCKDEPSLMCLAVYPEIISNAQYSSNMDEEGRKEDWDEWHKHLKEKGKQHPKLLAGNGIQYSARVNAPIILDHHAGPDEWKPQWKTEWKDLGNDTWVNVPFNDTKQEKKEGNKQD